MRDLLFVMANLALTLGEDVWFQRDKQSCVTAEKMVIYV